MTLPILDARDHSVWVSWWLAAKLHSGTRQHRARVDAAKRTIDECLEAGPKAALMWSGGKDSTALAHLVTAQMGVRIPLVSEKDDLDYPGEDEYVKRLAAQWEAELRIVVPSTSPQQWIREHARELSSAQDFHSRAAGLSRECFYGVVEESCRDCDVVLLGLRAEESRGRTMNRATRGLVYRKAPSKWNPSGLTVAQPIADWKGIDVYAYLASHDIEPLPVYRCVGFMHSKEPWRIRKSWWLPGVSSRHGQTAWLRRYWPSLFQKLDGWLPDASFYT